MRQVGRRRAGADCSARARARFGKSFVGRWGDDPAENLCLIAFNTATMLMTAWTLFARLWRPLGLTDRLEATGRQAGKPAD